MSRERLEALCRITAAVSQARQAEMAALRRQEIALRQHLSEIEAGRAASLSALDPEGPAVRAGAVMTWQAWIDQQKAGINGDLARLRARMIASRATLAEAHGRDQAMTGVMRNRARKESETAQRRQDNAGG